MGSEIVHWHYSEILWLYILQLCLDHIFHILKLRIIKFVQLLGGGGVCGVGAKVGLCSFCEL